MAQVGWYPKQMSVSVVGPQKLEETSVGRKQVEHGRSDTPAIEIVNQDRSFPVMDRPPRDLAVDAVIAVVPRLRGLNLGGDARIPSASAVPGTS